MDITKALKSLRPNSEFVTCEDEIVEWFDQTTEPPTKSEIDAEIARLILENQKNEYQRQRAAAYPSIQDQLDLLYHGGMDAWKAAITAVKTEFPK